MFCCTGSRKNYFRSVGRQNINNHILNFMVGTSKNKNIDHRVKETCVIMSIQVIYETIFLLRDSTMLNGLIFCFFMYFMII